MAQKPDFNIDRLIADCGGPKEVAAICNVARSTPYNWSRRRNIALEHLAALKLRFPRLDLNSYVELVNVVDA